MSSARRPAGERREIVDADAVIVALDQARAGEGLQALPGKPEAELENDKEGGNGTGDPPGQREEQGQRRIKRGHRQYRSG